MFDEPAVSLPVSYTKWWTLETQSEILWYFVAKFGWLAMLLRRTGMAYTQIYEGTNQIQRMVIARKTFSGVR